MRPGARSVLSLTPTPGFLRGHLVDGRYRLVEPLDDDDPSDRSAVWHAEHVDSGSHVVLDLVPANGQTLSVPSLLTRVGLDEPAVLEVGQTQAGEVAYFYVASTLPSPVAAVINSDVA